MITRYGGVVVRGLTQRERASTTMETETPLVLEAEKSSNAAFLIDFLQHYSKEVLAYLTAYGAVLIRGFEVVSSQDFESAVLSIRGMNGMNEIFCSEPGRTLADRSRFVHHTNLLSKTGGGFTIDSFHSENYFVPEVPRYVNFFCLLPSRLGGETGLLNMRKLYRDLPESLKVRLEAKACFAARYAIPELEIRYGVSAETIKHCCEQYGLPTVRVGRSSYVAVYKPSVVCHPVTNEKVLLVNVLRAAALKAALQTEFQGDYCSRDWWLHRLVWRCNVVRYLVDPELNPQRFYQWVRHWGEERSGSRADLFMEEETTLGSMFTGMDAAVVAKAMRRRYASFMWKKGDILLVDNFQLAHGGMPGRGMRDLRVMLCNPVWISSSKTSTGLHEILSSEQGRLPIGAFLKGCSQRTSSRCRVSKGS